MPLLNLKIEINSWNFHTVLYHDHNLRSLMIDRYHDHNDHNHSNDIDLPKTHKISKGSQIVMSEQFCNNAKFSNMFEIGEKVCLNISK